MIHMEKKYKIRFSDEDALQESIAYKLVSEYGIQPVILRAEIEGSGGILIIKLRGEEAQIDSAISDLGKESIFIEELGRHISRDMDKCFNCGSCVSVCPTKSFKLDPETFEVHLDEDTCVACGACISACSTKAVTLKL